MNIGHVSYVYQPIIGGQELYIQNLVDFFSALGHRQHVYQAAHDGAQEDGCVRIVSVPQGFKRKPVYLFDALLLKKWKKLKEEDIIIAHDAIYWWPVFWKKTITVSHCVRWNRPTETDGMYNAVHKFSARVAFKYSNKYVANDTYFFREMGIDLAPKEKKFEQIVNNRWFIPNCVDTNYYRKTEPHRSLKDQNVLLVPRRIAPEKGIDLAIEAFALVLDKYPDLILVICGDSEGRTEYTKKVLDMVKRFELERSIFFMGQFSQKEMPSVYSGAAMTIIPTKSEEGTALAALESMSCGIATVSTNIGGLQDLPTLQCNPDANELAQLIMECYPARRDIGKRQQEAVREDYTIEQFKQAWKEVIMKK